MAKHGLRIGVDIFMMPYYHILVQMPYWYPDKSSIIPCKAYSLEFIKRDKEVQYSKYFFLFSILILYGYLKYKCHKWEEKWKKIKKSNGIRASMQESIMNSGSIGNG